MEKEKKEKESEGTNNKDRIREKVLRESSVKNSRQKRKDT